VLLEGVRTVADHSATLHLDRVGDAWSSRAFDGPFFQSRSHRDRPSVGVVFVTSAAGDTVTSDPAALGGGRVDEHLIYEGVTRVAADAIVVGAGTLHPDSFFSVWRTELVAMRLGLGLPRHPVQVVLSANGSIDPDAVLLFNVPDVRVIILASPAGEKNVRDAISSRGWVTVVTGTSLLGQFHELKSLGVHRACSVGGRTAASALVDAGLVDDLYLTHAPGDHAAPGTPWYAGQRPPALASVLLKQWEAEKGTVTFGHSLISTM
jgi:riboflavin biosynthesis pyrimidine reductase